MSTTLAIINTLAGLAIIEGLFLVGFTKKVKEILKDVSRRKFLLKKIGLLEIVLGVLIVLVSISIYFFIF